jgi:iron complex outermembrane recepter protein
MKNHRLHAAAIALMLPIAALAQAPADPAADRKERIEVTGSRIVTSDVDSASPIAIIHAEEIKGEGYGTLELILNNFPQLVADQGSRISNGASGTSTVNLRGLLPSRTLVLVNGRRLLSGSPFLLAPDINQIPVHLISRIELLTGGASAVHGSDAIAGVVNVILKDRFEGVEGSVAYDFYNHQQHNARMTELLQAAGHPVPGDKGRDGATTVATLTLGGNFAGDKGNAAVSFRYVRSAALLQSDRDYSACALTIVNFGTPAQREACGGSNTSFPGLFFDVGSGRRQTVADAAGNVRPWTQRDLYNYGPSNYYTRPIERYGVNVFAHYDLSARTRVYSEFGFHDDNTVAQIAPSGLFGVFATVRHDNPLLSEAWRSALTFLNPDGTPGSGPGAAADVVILRRSVEGGGRRSQLRHTSYRELAGMKGAFFGPWDYDVFLQSAKVVSSEGSTRDFSLGRSARALDVVRHPSTGAPVCRSVLDGTDPACVPYDIWRLGGVTPEALAYIEAQALRLGNTSQTLFSASMRGELAGYGLRSPWTSESPELALGFERRSDRVSLKPDAAFASGDLAGSSGNSPPIEGNVNVKEVFAELRFPVLDALALTGSYRYSDYSLGAKTDTFGVGFNAVPTNALRLRGSFQRAIRAANLNELFEPEVFSEWGFTQEEDPCAGDVPARSLADCQRTGVTASQYGRIPGTPLGIGFNAVLGGNPRLEPETANTTTLGFALTPTPDFSATLDYFDIRVEDYITGGTPDVTFQRCLDTGDPQLCALIRRDPVLGTLWLNPARVVATNQNIGRVRVTGADVSFNYRFRSLVFISAIGTYTHRFSRENYRGAEADQCAGTFGLGCFEPRPKWRHRVRAAWSAPWGVEVATTWRYLHSVKHTFGVLEDLKAMNYLDIAASWPISRQLLLRLGVSNVFDRDPPLSATSGTATSNGNTYSMTYDSLGRHLYLSLTARF